MKNFNPPVLQEFVRDPLEISDKGIVSYILLKFAFKTLTKLALCQKLPTAYFPACQANFSSLEEGGAKIRQVAKKFASTQSITKISEFRVGALPHHWCNFALTINISPTLLQFCTNADYYNLKQSFTGKNELHRS